MVTAIQAIEPTYPHESAQRWQHTPADRERGRAIMAHDALRCFDVVWTPAERGRSFLWFGDGKEAFACQVTISTSYANVPPHLLAHMLIADGVDLLRALSQLPDPTTPGLSHFEELGMELRDVDSQANAVVDHRYRVHWAQATD